MKKVLITILFMLAAIGAYGQNTFKYQVRALGGLSIGNTADTVKIDSVILSGSFLKFYRGSSEVFAIDTTSLSDRINLKLNASDSTGILYPNYLTHKQLNDTIAYYAPLASPIFTGTVTTNNLHVDGSLEVGNTGLTIDSIGLVDSRIAFYDGPDTLGVHIIASDIEDLGDVAILLSDTTHTNNKHILYTQWQTDSIVTVINTSVSNISTSVSNARFLTDTIPIHTFNTGYNTAHDTMFFEAGSILGAFFNRSADTLITTHVISQISDGDSLTFHILYADTINAVIPTHVTDTIVLNDNGTVETTTFECDTIPPDVWVYAKAIATPDNKNPVFFSASLVGTKIKGTFDDYFLVENELSDGDTWAWYKSDVINATNGITKSESNLVSKWADYLGSGNDISVANSNYQPLWSSNGVLFDGSNDYLRSASLTLNQPATIWMVVKQVTWDTGNRTFFDGYSISTGRIYQYNTSPYFYGTAGTLFGANNNLAVDTWGIVRVIFNGASSLTQVNLTSPVTGDSGAGNMGGFTLGAAGNVGNFNNIQVKEVIIRKVDDDAATETLIYTYLKTKYGL